MDTIERVYYQLKNSGNLLKLFPNLTGVYEEDIIEFITIYKLLNP